MRVSLIIPVFNQIERLVVLLDSLKRQTFDMSLLEIVIVDDGSDIEVSNDETVKLGIDEFSNFKVIRQENKGRAVARNLGVTHSKGEIIIFCDADRFLSDDFIRLHYEHGLSSTHSIAIGKIKEIYTSNIGMLRRKYLSGEQNAMSRAKIPAYPRLVETLYSETGSTDSSIPWITTFSGNMSLRRELFIKVGGFSEKFIDWGLEHFEFGYRLHLDRVEFYYLKEAENYHIAHKRNVDQIANQIEKSIDVMSSLHLNCSIFSSFCDFMLGKISLQELEFNKSAGWLEKTLEPRIFTIGSL